MRALAKFRSRWGETLDLIGVFDDIDTVLDGGRNGIGVAGAEFHCGFPGKDTDASEQHIAPADRILFRPA